MSSRGRALQDVQPAEKPRYLLPCKDKARLYTPPGGTYAVVRDSEEFLDAMRQRGGDSRLIRVSDETSYLEILEPFVVPADMNVTIDCQGSVIDLQPPPSVPGESSVLNLYDCCVLGYPVGAPYLSETGVVSDTTLIGKCAVCSMASSSVQAPMAIVYTSWHASKYTTYTRTCLHAILLGFKL